MKTLLKSAVLLLGMGLVSIPSHAQKVVIEDNEPNSVMFISIDKAGNEIIRIMNETQNPRFHEPKAPRFLLTDRKGKFALGIGGYVKLAAEYDFGGISDNIDFYPAMIPGKGQSYVRNQFQMDATTSTVFLKLVGHTRLLAILSSIPPATSAGAGARLSNLGMLMCRHVVLQSAMITVRLWTCPMCRQRSTLPVRTGCLSTMLR